MNKFLTLSASTALLSGLFLITGCSSDDGGGGGGAVVPANAVVIDATNAEPIVQSAVDSTGVFDAALAVETTPNMSLKRILNTIEPFLKNHSNNSGANLATGVTESGECLGPGNGGGTFSETYTETVNGSAYSESGSASFVNCDFGVGFIINGALTYTGTGNDATGDYTDNITGSLSIVQTGGSGGFSFSFTGLNLAETGNYLAGTYTVTAMTYAIDFVSNGSGSGGFLVQLTAPIVESSGDFCPESGSVLVTGANGTTAEGIYNGDNTMTIKANGEVVNPAAPCYY